MKQVRKAEEGTGNPGMQETVCIWGDTNAQVYVQAYKLKKATRGKIILKHRRK